MLVYRRKFLANSLNTIEIQEILELLPHRYPFLLVDRVTDYVLGESVKAYKNITINEPCFMGHFPEQPIFPGVLILEAMAQAAGVLGFKTMGNNDKLYLYAGIDNARFKKQVVPGDIIVINAKLVQSKSEVHKFTADCKVDGEVVCKADLIGAVRPKNDT